MLAKEIGEFSVVLADACAGAVEELVKEAV
jgi:hypothetical protein